MGTILPDYRLPDHRKSPFWRAEKKFKRTTKTWTIPDRKIRIPKEKYESCKGCLRKRYEGYCPHGFTEENEGLSEGICQERKKVLDKLNEDII